jgi:hypothetical protein
MGTNNLYRLNSMLEILFKPRFIIISTYPNSTFSDCRAVFTKIDGVGGEMNWEGAIALFIYC